MRMGDQVVAFAAPGQGLSNEIGLAFLGINIFLCSIINECLSEATMWKRLSPLRRRHRFLRQVSVAGAQREEILETPGMAIYMGARAAAMPINHTLCANRLRSAQVGLQLTSERQDVV
jgi:hypothetical protein